MEREESGEREEEREEEEKGEREEEGGEREEREESGSWKLTAQFRRACGRRQAGTLEAGTPDWVPALLWYALFEQALWSYRPL